MENMDYQELSWTLNINFFNKKIQGIYVYKFFTNKIGRKFQKNGKLKGFSC
jgi:hypothetical protein